VSFGRRREGDTKVKTTTRLAAFDSASSIYFYGQLRTRAGAEWKSGLELAVCGAPELGGRAGQQSWVAAGEGLLHAQLDGGHKLCEVAGD